ncbi:MAG: hypothetical protein K0R90_498 [Oscillospiraceae bacterium]|nr:hypothetical protein [Oscillospiraceae bacterium]
MKKVISMILSGIITVSVLFAFPANAYAASASSTAGIVSTTSSSLIVRSNSSTSSAKLTSLPMNSYVTLISKTGSWWYVEYAQGKYGYCSADYIKQVSSSYSAYVRISSGYLNVRMGASTAYSIKDSLAKGENVVVLSQSGTFNKILYDGTKIGYVSSSYLKSYSDNTVSYPAISLSVPNFKQTDSRWNSFVIGNTGKTIGTIGCLTTALSMTESYRTGTTIYPNQMVSKLSYSSSGDLYWPSNYTFSTDSSYLGVLYAQLKSGKPVIFGAKNSSGKQHWVVVTGYKGASTLSAANFTVNDPGSNSRITLQQLLDVYPAFYKSAIYQ